MSGAGVDGQREALTWSLNWSYTVHLESGPVVFNLNRVLFEDDNPHVETLVPYLDWTGEIPDRLDDDYFALESRMILFAAGRLGMRAGEIRHLTAGWIDLRDGMISIPRVEQCTMGEDGGICGGCRQSAQQMTEHNEELDIETAEGLMWGPKTESAAREIPLDATTRAGIAIEAYFDRFPEFMASQTTLNRRVTRVAEEAVGLDPETTYPHCLRSTASSYWAAQGLNAINLKSLMGWADFSTAVRYIEESGERTAQSLRSLSG